MSAEIIIGLRELIDLSNPLGLPPWMNEEVGKEEARNSFSMLILARRVPARDVIYDGAFRELSKSSILPEVRKYPLVAFDLLGSVPEWEFSDESNLKSDIDLEYDGQDKEEEELSTPLPDEKLDFEERRKIVREFAKIATPEALRELVLRFADAEPIVPMVLNVLFDAVGKSTPPEEARGTTEAAVEYVPTVSRWAERTTKESPGAFIIAHYGRPLPDGSWDPMGLTRADLLRSDPPLYKAYAQWIGRLKGVALDKAPKLPTKSKVLEERAERLGLLVSPATPVPATDEMKVIAALRVRRSRLKMKKQKFPI